MTEPAISDDEQIAATVTRYLHGWIVKATYLDRMAKLGYQQIEALEIAENWVDEP